MHEQMALEGFLMLQRYQTNLKVLLDPCSIDQSQDKVEQYQIEDLIELEAQVHYRKGIVVKNP